MPASRLIFVTGATGWIGHEVCRQFVSRGNAVAALSRQGDAAFATEVFRGTLEAFRDPPKELLDLLGRSDAVVHCAGRAHRPVESDDEMRLFEETNVRGTVWLVEACRKAGVRRIVYVSTIAGCDWKSAAGEPVDEEAALSPLSAYARTKLAGERHVRDSGVDWRVVRLATVFGSGDKANFSKLASALKRRRFLVPGNGSVMKSVIPVTLAAELLTRMALKPEPSHRLVNAALPDAPALREICDGFSDECSFPRAPSIPVGVLRAGAWVGDCVRTLWPGVPLTTMTLDKLTTSTVVATSRMYENFPDFPRISFRSALSGCREYYQSL